jgi:hypothetical protein
MMSARSIAAFASVTLAVFWSVVACSSGGAAGGDGGRDVASLDAPSDGSSGGDGAYDGGPDGGTPHLVELRVSAQTDSGAAPSITLVPKFSPGVFDYYVQCAAGANALTVSMKASPGTRSLLIQPVATASLPEQVIPLAVNENDAIVAAATDGTATVEYWVRCLPHDFPSLEMSLHPEAGAPIPGYYLVGNALLRAGAGYAMALDVRGVPVWYQRTPQVVLNVDSVIPGTISFFSPYSYQVDQLAPPGTSYLPPLARSEHDYQVLPGGDYYLITSPVTTNVDLTGLSLPLADGGAAPLGPGGIIEDCVVDELDPAGQVFWSWVASKHLDPVKDCTFPQVSMDVPPPDGGVVADVFHCNSVDVDPANGNLLISARHTDSVFYVDRVTGNILWKMGGAAYTKDDAAYVSVKDPFYRQHDGRLQTWKSTCSGGSGQVSVFDDETERPDPARAVVYDVSVGPGDAGTGADCGAGAGDGGTTPATVAWQYIGKAPAQAMGSFRILADGSRVIGWGVATPHYTSFSEVDLAGRDLLDFNLDYANLDGSYRAIKVPATALDLGLLRAAAGLP